MRYSRGKREEHMETIFSQTFGSGYVISTIPDACGCTITVSVREFEGLEKSVLEDGTLRLVYNRLDAYPVTMQSRAKLPDDDGSGGDVTEISDETTVHIAATELDAWAETFLSNHNRRSIPTDLVGTEEGEAWLASIVAEVKDIFHAAVAAGGAPPPAFGLQLITFV